MLLNLSFFKGKRDREGSTAFLASLGSSSPPSPGAVICQLVTRLITHLNDPQRGSGIATITVSKQTTIT